MIRALFVFTLLATLPAHAYDLKDIKDYVGSNYADDELFALSEALRVANNDFSVAEKEARAESDRLRAGSVFNQMMRPR